MSSSLDTLSICRLYQQYTRRTIKFTSYRRCRNRSCHQRWKIHLWQNSLIGCQPHIYVSRILTQLFSHIQILTRIVCYQDTNGGRSSRGIGAVIPISDSTISLTATATDSIQDPKITMIAQRSPIRTVALTHAGNIIKDSINHTITSLISQQLEIITSITLSTIISISNLIIKQTSLQRSTCIVSQISTWCTDTYPVFRGETSCACRANRLVRTYYAIWEVVWTEHACVVAVLEVTW